ncbi:MAG: hypothetical protein RLZ14_2014 [Actinomycetota bacterium]
MTHERLLAVAADRQFTDGCDDERTALRRFLDFQRATFARKLVGLSDEQLRMRAVAPSNMSLLGLVRHHAEGERGLMQIMFLGEEHESWWVTDETPELDWSGVDDADVAADIDRWLDAVEASRAAESRVPSLDVASTGPELYPGQGPVNLRWVLVHLVEEYARHNGHADLLRERIDGTTGY